MVLVAALAPDTLSFTVPAFKADTTAFECANNPSTQPLSDIEAGEVYAWRTDCCEGPESQPFLYRQLPGVRGREGTKAKFVVVEQHGVWCFVVRTWRANGKKSCWSNVLNVDRRPAYRQPLALPPLFEWWSR
jgi:hypothetical protein